jgi:hypothetical protein
MPLANELSANKGAHDPSANDDDIGGRIAIGEDGLLHGFTTSDVAAGWGGAVVVGLAMPTSGGAAAHQPGPPIA